MSQSVRIFFIILAVAITSRHPLPASAQNGADVARAIDRRFDQLDLAGRPVVDVLADLGQRAGIPIIVDDRAIELLPWGRKTRLSDVTIKHATLRDALSRITEIVGMAYEERDGKLVVVAGPPLECMNRRATWADLELLDRCNHTQYSADAFKTFPVQYRITSKVDAPAMLATQLARAGRGTVAQMLEVATASLGWTWFPNGDHLVIMTRQAQIAHRLARRVTCRYMNEPLSKILLDLSKKADVCLNLEPGMMRKLPPSTAQSYTLVLQQSSLRQALEVICAETGLKYEMRRDGLSVGLAANASAGGTATGRRSPYVCKISVPGPDGSFSYEFLVRENELPADILDYRRQIIEATLDKMRADMAPNPAIRSETGGSP